MTQKTFSRREFLKLAGLFSLGAASPQWINLPKGNSQKAEGDNILIIVFDAWSAAHSSLFGYARQTTPQLERLANKAIVYHNHFMGGQYTPPGTVSLLTGTLPWTHRAFDFDFSLEPEMRPQNIFRLFDHYHRMAYTHNPIANILLRELMADIDDYIPWGDLYLEVDPLITDMFLNDHDIATIGWKRALDRLEDGYAYSLLFSDLYQKFISNRIKRFRTSMPNFPRGVPRYDTLAFFTLEQGIDWLSTQAGSVPQPFLGYFHFFPPHDPYLTRVDFYDRFVDDGYIPIHKPDHFLKGKIELESLIDQRRWYDEFILYVDAEFARLYQNLEQAGILDNTWVVLTSDHGEIFERGIIGHTTPVFYQPIAHIPLVIFPPGASSRVDVFENTSAVDLLPTLAAVNGQEIPAWAEGRVLPPFGRPEPEQEISSVQVEYVDNSKDIVMATAMLVQGNLKLIWSFGYDEIETGDEWIELYNLVQDPEETHNLYPDPEGVGASLLNTLKVKLGKLNQTYKT